jgi:Membrane protein involved in the export of O-antigen and teichoic acid
MNLPAWRLPRRFQGSKFARSVAVVASGTALAQVVTMAASPLVTRLYGAEAFGVLGTFTAIVNTLLPVAALNYPSAIGLPKSELEARKIAFLSIRISICTSLMVLVVLLIAGGEISRLLNLQGMEGVILLVPLAMFFSAICSVTNQTMIRHRLFSTRARVTVAQSILLNATKVGWGLHGPTAIALVVIATFGRAAHAFMLQAGLRFHRSDTDENQTAVGSFDLARRYIDFPRYQMPLGFSNAFAEALPALMLGALYGPRIVGFYVLCRTILWLPVGLVAQSVGEVFYPRINEAVREGADARNLIMRSTMALSCVALFPCLMLVIAGPKLFSFVFGQEWSAAGEFARVMAILLFSAFVNRPSMASAPALRLQRYLLANSVVGVGLKALGIYLGYLWYADAVASVAGFSIAGTVSNIVIIRTAIARAGRIGRCGKDMGDGK